jgi:hypothetical protein
MTILQRRFLFSLVFSVFLAFPLAGAVYALHESHAHETVHFHPENGKTHSHDNGGLHSHPEDVVPFFNLSAYKLSLAVAPHMSVVLISYEVHLPIQRPDRRIDPPPYKSSPPLLSSSFNKAPPAS